MDSDQAEGCRNNLSSDVAGMEILNMWSLCTCVVFRVITLDSSYNDCHYSIVTPGISTIADPYFSGDYIDWVSD